MPPVREWIELTTLRVFNWILRGIVACVELPYWVSDFMSFGRPWVQPGPADATENAGGNTPQARELRDAAGSG